MKAESAIKSAAASAANKVRNGADAAQEKIDESVDVVSARLAALEALWKEYGDLLVKNAKEIGSAAGKQVRANPVTAFGVAFVAGLAVARLLRR